MYSVAHVLSRTLCIAHLHCASSRDKGLEGGERALRESRCDIYVHIAQYKCTGFTLGLSARPETESESAASAQRGGGCSEMI